MTGDSYIYEVRHIDNPSFVESFSSIKKVRKHTGLSEESVVKCFDEHKYIKGWIVGTVKQAVVDYLHRHTEDTRCREEAEDIFQGSICIPSKW